MALDDFSAHFGKRLQADWRFQHGADYAFAQREGRRFQFEIKLLLLDHTPHAACDRGRAP
jgi:hypothetical protein